MAERNPWTLLENPGAVGTYPLLTSFGFFYILRLWILSDLNYAYQSSYVMKSNRPPIKTGALCIPGYFVVWIVVLSMDWLKSVGNVPWFRGRGEQPVSSLPLPLLHLLPK